MENVVLEGAGPTEAALRATPFRHGDKREIGSVDVPVLNLIREPLAGALRHDMAFQLRAVGLQFQDKFSPRARAILGGAGRSIQRGVPAAIDRRGPKRPGETGEENEAEPFLHILYNPRQG